MYNRIKGIVLRRTRFSDSHGYITVMTNDGVVEFTAKGIFSPKSKYSSACSLYTLSEFVLLEKGNSKTLSSAEVICHVIKQGIDLSGLALANYVSTLAYLTSISPEDCEKVYNLLLATLDTLEKHKADRETIKAVFEWKLTSYLGFTPGLELCEECGCETKEGHFIPFDGTVVCEKCKSQNGKKSIYFSEHMTSALKKLISLDDRNSFGIKFSNPDDKKIFENAAEEFSQCQLESAKNALTFYHENNI